ncbi:epoxide hydrolase family protein [Microbacterium hydrocarbonoxydans]|uniref:epoxide hydrolase family protein n=1 Tax=Microbacterium hydrocarbonoxydans TaxID=273678 RepID=UPI00203B190D|nr:epoxide hydrolase family protein [Microbacterium hydrocarbonoxydans]MCM3778284.1 epoxide hydrolase [Microbacterium hydrocarbonoxydans]
MGEQAAPPPVVPDDIDDLIRRLRAFRAVPVPDGHGWNRGVESGYVESLMDYWASEYDWRAQEERIRGLGWEFAGASPSLRVVHRPAREARATVLLLHGWPDSVLRFEKILPRLDDVNVVAPALPGFPFAAPVPEGGMSSVEMAAAVADAMSDLGYARYIVSAGDVGCDVAEALAAAHPDAVAALHLTDVSQYHFLVDPPEDLSPQEREYVRYGHRWQAAEGGYMHEQSTKPHTVAVGLGDSPAGLAAWILEKLRAWTDCNGDVESVFTRDELLTWVSVYWFGRCIGTSFTPYAAAGAKSWPKITTPTVFTVFAKDLVNAPRDFAERFFAVEQWTEYERGGHFAAWEQPDAYLSGITSAIDIATRQGDARATRP